MSGYQKIPEDLSRAFYRSRRVRKAYRGLRDQMGVSGPRNSSKVGRNEPCPCGSGLKFKRCCIDKAAS